MSEYIKIVAKEHEEREPFLFEIDGKKFELPALSESSAPLELLPALLLVASDDPSEEDVLKAGAGVLEYFRREESKLWRTLKMQKSSLAWINGLIEQWVEFSKIDPKV